MIWNISHFRNAPFQLYKAVSEGIFFLLVQQEINKCAVYWFIIFKGLEHRTELGGKNFDQLYTQKVRKKN